MKALLFEKYEGNHLEEISYLLNHLKPEDADEALITHGEDTIKEALLLSLQLSEEAFIVKGLSGNPIWAFGIAKNESERGRCVWLVGTDESYQYKREFLIHSKNMVNRWKNKYGKLYNCIPVTYKKALRWVEYLGATFLEEVDLPNGKVIFYSIE